MPRIPGVPDLETVAKPYASPAEFGRAGGAIAQMAGTAEDISLEGLGFEEHIRKAQQHVDMLAARNELDAAVTATQTELAKTQNSRDIPNVLVDGQSNLNEISKRWSASPAALQIQMDADSLRPGLQHVSQMRQIDLMGKEFKVSLSRQGEVFAEDYAAARAAGDSGDQALRGFSQAVQGGVATGLIGDVEAQETVRQFRVAGQSLEVRQALESLSPKTNQDMVNKLQQHPEEFPDLTREQISDLIEKGNGAFESHTRQKEWADQQLVKQAIVPAIIHDNTDQSGIFHLDQALKQASRLPIEQEETASEALRGHAANANADLMDVLNKADDKIENAIQKNDFRGATQIADTLRPQAENAGLPWYASQTKLIDAARHQRDAEYRADWHFDEAEKRVADQASSMARANQLMPDIISGKITQQTLNDSVGEGPGKIDYKTYLQMSNLVGKIQKEPDTQAALNVLYDSLPVPPKGSSADQQVQYDMMKWNLFQQWQQGVGEKNLKGDDKTKYAIELVKPFVQKDVAARLDNLLNQQNPQPTRMQMLKGTIGSYLNIPSWEFPLPDAPKDGAAPARPKGVPDNATWNPNANQGKGAWQVQ